MGEQPRQAGVSSRTAAAARAATLLGLSVFAAFSMMLATGAASFVNECRGIWCGQLHQAVFAAIAGAASLLAAARVLTGRPHAAAFIFFGTLPLLVVHIVLVVSDPNESMFFPLSTAPVPAVAAAVLLYGTARSRTAVGTPSVARRGRTPTGAEGR